MDEAFRSLCALRGISHTQQRQVIYEALHSLHDHPSPEEIYEVVRKINPSISLATVYKNIKTFVDHGLLAEVSLHHGSTRLETNLQPHHHLVCSHCKAIFDIDRSDLQPVRWNKPAPAGFAVHRYSVEFIGICQTCAGMARSS